MPWNFNAGFVLFRLGYFIALIICLYISGNSKILFRTPMLNYNDNFELRIHIVDADVTKILPLDPEATIFQLCEDIRKNIREAQTKSR